MIEVADGEEFKPGSGVRLRVVNKFKWSHEFKAQAAMDLVDHSDGVSNRVVPELAVHLFLGDV